MIEEVKEVKKPVIKEVVKTLLTFKVSDLKDLEVLTHRMKVRYGAKLKEKTDTKAIFEGKEHIIELVKA